MRWLPLTATLLVSSLLPFGCGRQDVRVSLTQRAPVLGTVTMSSGTQFGFEGGQATVSVPVQSGREVTVVATRTRIHPPGGETATFLLHPVGGGQYQGVVLVPQNTLNTGEAMDYTLSVVATDEDGVASEPIVLQLRVEAPMAPPDNPPAPPAPPAP